MNPNYPFVAERAGHRCEYCHAPETIFNVPFEVEHIIPISKDGIDHESNWALACRACNLNKSNLVDGIDPVTQTHTPLFHPRQNIWTDHFAIEPASSIRLVGRTPIGRATIEKLRMSSPLQLTARAQWIELGLFP